MNPPPIESVTERALRELHTWRRLAQLQAFSLIAIAILNVAVAESTFRKILIAL